MVLPSAIRHRLVKFGRSARICRRVRPVDQHLVGWSAPELVDAGFSRQRLLLGVVLTVVVVLVLGRAAVVPGTRQPVHVDPMSPAEGDRLDPPT